MKPLSDKCCRENQKISFFSEILPFMRYCGKILKRGAGHR
jgi:hypothetical protein